ncbi:RHS repeat-associated core domain-containing protein [Cryobacterium sp. GrIS_2_6]|uniref:RHS repeat-associated core domain-containing protein n=1 Tax=Cryobacterium sp. GrIS_2_6 TaxID=3162785 RepID=UPI002E155BD5
MHQISSSVLASAVTYVKVATFAYDSWGDTTSPGAQAANNPWQYAGGYKDVSTGYTKFGALYYNPAIGRFTQVDPSGQDANRYAYAGCNPISGKDPTGLAPTGCSAGLLIVGTIVGVTWTAAGVLSPTVAGGIVAAVAGTVFTLFLGILSLYCD